MVYSVYFYFCHNILLSFINHNELDLSGLEPLTFCLITDTLPTELQVYCVAYIDLLEKYTHLIKATKLEKLKKLIVTHAVSIVSNHMTSCEILRLILILAHGTNNRHEYETTMLLYFEHSCS